MTCTCPKTECPRHSNCEACMANHDGNGHCKRPENAGKNMNTLIAVNIAPLGTAGQSLAEHVVEVIRVIQASGLPHRTTAMFAEVEGEWDAVMQVVKDATFVLAKKGLRISVTLKADVQIGAKNKLTGKVEKINQLLDTN